MWPAEGAVGEGLIPLLARHGIRWIATDEGVLARSGRHGYRVDDPHVLCQPYQAADPQGRRGVSVLFRSRSLSDAIGFQHGSDPDPEHAVQSFVESVKALARGLRGERDYLVSVILDGENAWGSYRDDGRPFLHALYRALATDGEIKTVTISEYLDGESSRRVSPHPVEEQARVHELFTGSWVDEYGSAPGADLGTWVGEPEENDAWALLAEVRALLDEAGVSPRSEPEAFRALYAAEGSDWFWWLGADHQSDSDEAFDDLFRGHLKAACRLAGVDPPAALDRHIVPHRAVWTFSAPIGSIQSGDQLVVRTNCPGTLSWSTDAWVTAIDALLSPVGGVMAGPARYAVALGPFDAGTTLAFRFRCGHPGCGGEMPCCRGGVQRVKIVERP
jgi:alpha-amylase/alpha-mannosidase (GH57 family)